MTTRTRPTTVAQVPEKPLFIAKQHPMRNLVIAYGNMAYSISTGTRRALS